MSSIAEHLGGHQPGHARTNHNHPPGLQGSIEAQGHDFEQLLVVRVVHAFLEGVIDVGRLPVQGGHQAEEDGDQGEEAPGWGQEDRVSGQVGGCVDRGWWSKAGSAPSPPDLPKGSMTLVSGLEMCLGQRGSKAAVTGACVPPAGPAGGCQLPPQPSPLGPCASPNPGLASSCPAPVSPLSALSPCPPSGSVGPRLSAASSPPRAPQAHPSLLRPLRWSACCRVSLAGLKPSGTLPSPPFWETQLWEMKLLSWVAGQMLSLVEAGVGGGGESTSICFLPLAPNSSGAAGRLQVHAQATVLSAGAAPGPLRAPGPPELALVPALCSASFSGWGRGWVHFWPWGSVLPGTAESYPESSLVSAILVPWRVLTGSPPIPCGRSEPQFPAQ